MQNISKEYKMFNSQFNFIDYIEMKLFHEKSSIFLEALCWAVRFVIENLFNPIYNQAAKDLFRNREISPVTKS